MFSNEILEVIVTVKGKDKTWTITIPRSVDVEFSPKWEEDEPYFPHELVRVMGASRLKSFYLSMKPILDPETSQYGTFKVADN